MSYSKIVFDENLSLSWVYPYTGGEVLSDINDMDATAAGKGVTLPAANLIELGTKLIFNNVGSNSFIINDYGATEEIWTLLSGQVITIYLTSNLDANGQWCAIPFGSGTSGVVSVGVSSNNSSIVVGNSPITTGQSGTISLSLSNSIANLNNITSTGFAAVTQTNPLTWTTRELIAGSNIEIVNTEGVEGNPNISITPTITDLTSITAGTINITENIISSVEPDGSLIINSKAAGTVTVNDFSISPDGISVNAHSTIGKIQISESTITNTDGNGSIVIESTGSGNVIINGVNITPSSNVTNLNDLTAATINTALFTSGNISIANSLITTDEDNGDVNITSKGTGDVNIVSTGTVNINDVSVDTTSNVTGIKNLTVESLTVTDKITNSGISVAGCFFSDNNTLTVSNNTINVYSNFNIESVTGGLGAYIVKFITPLEDSNYIVQLSLCHGVDTMIPFAAYFTDRATDQFKIVTIDTQGNLLPVTSGISVSVFGNITI